MKSFNKRKERKGKLKKKKNENGDFVGTAGQKKIMKQKKKKIGNKES